jgi:hypothetical protein
MKSEGMLAVKFIEIDRQQRHSCLTGEQASRVPSFWVAFVIF